MFHIHVCGTERKPPGHPVEQWLSGYDGSEYSNNVMGQWFGLYKLDVKLFIIYIDHPVHPV